MTTERTALFCSIALAERIERAEARLVAAVTRAAHRRTGDPGFVLPLAGGVACFAEDGSPFTKVAGLGFAGAPDDDELTAVERAFAERGAPVQVELAHLADPALGALLSARGYRLAWFENVLGRALDRPTEPVVPPGIDIRPSGDDEFDLGLTILTAALAG